MSREFIINVDLGNDAFRADDKGPDRAENHKRAEGRELARILRNLADQAEQGLTMGEIESGKIYDANGNSVGHWLVEGEREFEIVGYVIVDRDGDRIDDEVYYDQIDAQRKSDEMVEEDLETFAESEDDPETFKALQKHNDAPYRVMGIDNDDDLFEVKRLENVASPLGL
jgi:hypothetical protein